MSFFKKLIGLTTKPEPEIMKSKETMKSEELPLRQYRVMLEAISQNGIKRLYDETFQSELNAANVTDNVRRYDWGRQPQKAFQLKRQSHEPLVKYLADKLGAEIEFRHDAGNIFTEVYTTAIRAIATNLEIEYHRCIEDNQYLITRSSDPDFPSDELEELLIKTGMFNKVFYETQHLKIGWDAQLAKSLKIDHINIQCGTKYRTDKVRLSLTQAKALRDTLNELDLDAMEAENDPQSSH